LQGFPGAGRDRFLRLSEDRIGREAPGQMVVNQAHAARRAQILMHHQPHFEIEADLAGQHRQEIGIAARDRVLAAADSEARAQRGEARMFAVAPERKRVARNRQAAGPQRA